jgi:hypothetical protein
VSASLKWTAHWKAQTKMNTSKLNLLAGLLAVSILSDATGQNTTFTSQFPTEDCHFSAFGGQPYFALNPGHQLVLKGKEDGEQKVLIITALNICIARS